MSVQAVIPAGMLDLLLATAKLRKSNQGLTAQFCLLSNGPTLTTTCHESEWMRAATKRDAPRFGISRATFMPMQRGGISALYERVNVERGRAEVRRTWHTGIRRLRAEPHHVLNGMAAQ